LVYSIFGHDSIILCRKAIYTFIQAYSQQILIDIVIQIIMKVGYNKGLIGHGIADG